MEIFLKSQRLLKLNSSKARYANEKFDRLYRLPLPFAGFAQNLCQDLFAKYKIDLRRPDDFGLRNSHC